MSDRPPSHANESAEQTELTAEEKEELIEAEIDALPISYSGQDFDVSGLVRRLDGDHILIPIFGHDDDRISSEGFQRSFVWTRKQMDRFIESLLLGYPIPGIFLVRQEDRRYLVLDGQQRLRTLRFFYSGIYGERVFSLQNVAAQFKGLTYALLNEEQRRLLDDTFIPATIVSTDGSESSLEAVYQIFERLNSGGTPLTAHEIRVALYAGPFIDSLSELNNDDNWRAIYGKKSPRLRDQELILRIVALLFSTMPYEAPLKTFLNGFTALHRSSSDFLGGEPSRLFRRASALIREASGFSLLRLQSTQLNSALTEAVFVELMRLFQRGVERSSAQVSSAISQMLDDTLFLQAVSRATANEDTVKRRLNIAASALMTV